jgi:hypothetical protein
MTSTEALLARLEERQTLQHEQVMAQLVGILDEAKKTNGRITRLEQAKQIQQGIRLAFSWTIPIVSAGVAATVAILVEKLFHDI